MRATQRPAVLVKKTNAQPQVQPKALQVSLLRTISLAEPLMGVKFWVLALHIPYLIMLLPRMVPVLPFTEKKPQNCRPFIFDSHAKVIA